MNIFWYEKCDKVMMLLANGQMNNWDLLLQIRNESESEENNRYILDKLVQEGYIAKKAIMGYSLYSLTPEGKFFISEGGYSEKIKAEKEKQERERKRTMIYWKC